MSVGTERHPALSEIDPAEMEGRFTLPEGDRPPRERAEHPDARLRAAEARHAEDIGRLQARLREVEAERDEARRGAQWVAQAGARPRRRDALRRRLARRRLAQSSLRSGPAAGPIVLVLVLAAAVTAAVLLTGGAGDTGDRRPAAVSPPAPASSAASEGTPAGAVEPCAEAPLQAAAARITCRTATGAVLTIAPKGRPVTLGDLEARVLRSTVVGEGLLVRVRLRNESDVRQVVERSPRIFYLRVADQRIRGVDVGGPRSLAPRTTETVTLSFELDPATAQALERSGEADLGVVPFAERGAERPRNRGVIRLDIGR